MARLTIYGDFNCPFSALASVRTDVLLTTADAYEIDWRAIQHDTAIPPAGEAVEGDTALALTDEVAAIAHPEHHDVRLHLAVRAVRSNTASACAALARAGDDADRLRRRLFAATPTLVLPDGYLSRGLGALAGLAAFEAATPSSSSPQRGSTQ
jgi:hypothetical protein